MTLQFVLGKASFDHQSKMISKLNNDMKENPEDKFFYLVPNHVKFDSEVEVLKGLADPNARTSAQNKVQIFSFSRMAWYFLRNTPEYQRQRITAAGINMLLYQIIADHQSELILFQQEVAYPGFINQVAQEIREIELGNISPEDLQNILKNKKTGFSNDLVDKLHDFAIIYSDFVKRVTNRYFDNNTVLNLLNQYFNDHDIARYHFYISGFSKLNAQEFLLVSTLIKRSAQVTISLVLDKAYPVELPEAANLFYQSAKLFLKLYKFASEAKVPYLPVEFADKSATGTDLAKLENYWVQSNNAQAKITNEKLTENSIEIYKTDNPYSELNRVAAQIHRLVANGSFRYFDFLILTRHLDSYQNVIQPIFEAQDIPFFEDIQKSMVNHPLVEFLGALFDIGFPQDSKNKYRHDDVMRLLKTELILPKTENGYLAKDQYRNDLALAENLALKNGYDGSRWIQKVDWQYVWLNDAQDNVVVTDEDKQISKQINVIRHLIKDTLPPFYKKISRAKNNQEAAAILYQFLDEAGVIDQLQIIRKNAIDNSDLVFANQIEQVWGTFCSLLDENVAILGQNKFDPNEFWSLLYSGFQAATYSSIPSTLDQVTISESGMVQSNHYKVTFMIGSDDENMPAVTENQNLFGDDDVEQISQKLNKNQFLSDPAQQVMAFEPYLNYLAFMTATDKLIFSFNAAGQDSSSRQISPYLNRIADHFGLKINHFAATAKDNLAVLPYVGAKRATLHSLIQVCQDAYSRNVLPSDSWTFIYHKLNDDRQFVDLLDILIHSITYKNAPQPLSAESVNIIYPKNLNISISQLESYYQNPYEYFLKYGLKLQERDEFELSSASKGTFYHEALDLIVKQIKNQNIDLANLDEKDIPELVAENVAKMMQGENKYQYAILGSSSRMKFLADQLEKTVQEMVKILKFQAQTTPMRPQTTEKVFGQPGKDTLKGISFRLDDGRFVNVRGRIDRIDSMTANNKRYFGIVDYKSGNRNFEYNQAYSGVSMQLLTYLDVLRKNLPALSPDDQNFLAGVLYMHISNPKIDGRKLSNSDSLFKEEMKAHKYNGLLLNDNDLLANLDPKIIGSSEIFPYRFAKTKGTYSGDLIKLNDLQGFLAHNEMLIKKAAENILDGKIDLFPYQDNDKSAMQYTPYKSVMNFDPLLSENRYNDISKLDKSEILKLIRKEQQ